MTTRSIPALIDDTTRHIDEVKRVKHICDLGNLEVEADSLQQDITAQKLRIRATIRFVEESVTAIKVLNAAVEAYTGKAHNAEHERKRHMGIWLDYKEAIFEMRCLTTKLPSQFLAVFGKQLAIE
jgi:uncharacterized protein YoxC